MGKTWEIAGEIEESDQEKQRQKEKEAVKEGKKIWEKTKEEKEALFFIFIWEKYVRGEQWKQ